MKEPLNFQSGVIWHQQEEETLAHKILDMISTTGKLCSRISSEIPHVDCMSALIEDIEDLCKEQLKRE